MPVQETKAKLWFNTPEEVQAYDDRMIANIELKEGQDQDDPDFTLLAPRVRKEKMPALNEKALKAFEDFKRTDDINYKFKHSYKYFHDWTIEKKLMGMALGFMVLREMPIRNFYARSFIFACLGYKVLSNYRIRGPFTAIETAQVFQGDDQTM